MRIALATWPAPGHLFPAAALATALQARGHEVVIHTGAEWVEPLARQGLPARALPWFPPHEDEAHFSFRLFGRAVQMAPPLARSLRADRADAVVVDTISVFGAFAAELAGRPWLELIPHPLQDASDHLPVPGSGMRPGWGPWPRVRDAALRPLHRRSVAAGERQRAMAARAAGLDRGTGPVGRLVATLPGLELPRPDWPPRTVVVGPMEWDPADRDLPVPTGDGPVVFLAASTASSRLAASAMLERTIEACGRLGVRLVSTQFEPYVAALPPWACVGPGRQAPLLDLASVVVSGGGHGMVAKALVRGLPLLVVPGGGEQWDNAQRVRRLGAGVRVRPTWVTTDRLAAGLGRLLGDPAYAAAARRIAATGRPGEHRLGPAYAARTVELLLR